MKSLKFKGPLALLIALLVLTPLAVRITPAGADAGEMYATPSHNHTVWQAQSQDNQIQQTPLNPGAQAPNSGAPQDSLPLKGKTIVVDPGHGGIMSGAVRNLPPAASGGKGKGSSPGSGRQGTRVLEKDITLAIALKTAAKLRSLGATVVMTRSDDSDVSLEDRVNLSNNVKADFFLSVHINASTDTRADGIETYYYTAQSECPARHIHDALVKGLPEKGRWVRQEEFYVVHHTTAPSVLAEVGYMSRKDKLAKLVTDQYQDKIAESLAKGVAAYFTQPCPTASRIDAIMEAVRSWFHRSAQEPEACSLPEEN